MDIEGRMGTREAANAGYRYAGRGRQGDVASATQLAVTVSNATEEGHFVKQLLMRRAGDGWDAR